VFVTVTVDFDGSAVASAVPHRVPLGHHGFTGVALGYVHGKTGYVG